MLDSAKYTTYLTQSSSTYVRLCANGREKRRWTGYRPLLRLRSRSCPQRFAAGLVGPRQILYRGTDVAAVEQHILATQGILLAELDSLGSQSSGRRNRSPAISSLPSKRMPNRSPTSFSGYSAPKNTPFRVGTARAVVDADFDENPA